MVRIAIVGFSLLLLLACGGGTKEVKHSIYNESGMVVLSAEQLQKLGIFIEDSAVMYNNSIEGVGIVDIVIRDKMYYGNKSTHTQTNLPFYPRYITTLDTVQRAMYMLSGHTAEGDEEAKKWQTFESLVPVVVEQKSGDVVFGETLIFWMTKMSELERLLKEIEAN